MSSDDKVKAAENSVFESVGVLFAAVMIFLASAVFGAMYGKIGGFFFFGAVLVFALVSVINIYIRGVGKD